MTVVGLIELAHHYRAVKIVSRSSCIGVHPRATLRVPLDSPFILRASEREITLGNDED